MSPDLQALPEEQRAHVAGKWHRGSRYYLLASWALFLNVLLTGVALFVDGDHKAEALIQHGIVMGVIFGGSAAFNYRERANAGPQ